MAQVTFNIPNSKIQLFIDCYGSGYDNLVEAGEIDGEAVSKQQYAKEEAFKFLAQRVKKWHKQKQSDLLDEVDISVE